MKSGPHHSSNGKRLGSRKRTIMRRLGDHVSTGPSGVAAQSVARISCAISLSPGNICAVSDMVAADTRVLFSSILYSCIAPTVRKLLWNCHEHKNVSVALHSSCPVHLGYPA